MTPLQKIRTSFSTQLSLWVAGFVLVISTVVIILLARFSEDVIRDETIDATLQALENTALRIDNTLRQLEMTARLENQQLRVNRSRIERLIEESGSLEKLQQSLPNAQLFVTRRDSSQLDTYLTGNERGYRQLTHEDLEMFIFLQPVGEWQYSLAAVCPAEDIYSKYSRMHQVLLIWGIGGVLLLLYVLYLVIARHLRPLHQLADAAQSIAGGNLDTPIPDSRHKHETGRLQSNLKKMQRSLREYMDEMQQKQTMLSRQNAELQAAYSEAQAYETMKAKFLTKMTAKMAAPVEQVCRNTEDLCNNYATLSKADMNALQTDIANGTNTIVELLDQLIKEPADT
ncbi:MAG: HAMP domain-containing protein [Prevotella sp.]|nr:HAMP domain-containing protein [Prevotella sp.]